MQEVEALSRAGETVFTALRPYDLHDSIVSVDLFTTHAPVFLKLLHGPILWFVRHLFSHFEIICHLAHMNRNGFTQNLW